jgi:membrane-associated phospholipid phosphatase
VGGRPVPYSAGVTAHLRRGVLNQGWRSAALDVALIPAMLGTNLIYDLLNHGPSRIFLRTPLDDALPVVPVFAVPYVSLIPFIGVSLLLMLFRRARVYRSAALSMIVVWFISYAFYVFLQSFVSRPHVGGSDVFSSLVRWVYSADQPYNDFPSLHTSLSTIIAIHWWHIDRRIGVPAAAWTALIVASTVLIKQHYLADVVAGLLLAAAASMAMLRWTQVAASQNGCVRRLPAAGVDN